MFYSSPLVPWLWVSWQETQLYCVIKLRIARNSNTKVGLLMEEVEEISSFAISYLYNRLCAHFQAIFTPLWSQIPDPRLNANILTFSLQCPSLNTSAVHNGSPLMFIGLWKFAYSPIMFQRNRANFKAFVVSAFMDYLRGKRNPQGRFEARKTPFY